MSLVVRMKVCIINIYADFFELKFHALPTRTIICCKFNQESVKSWIENPFLTRNPTIPFTEEKYTTRIEHTLCSGSFTFSWN